MAIENILKNKRINSSRMGSSTFVKTRDKMATPEMQELLQQPDKFRARYAEVAGYFEPGGKYERSFGPTPQCVTHDDFDYYLDRRLS